MQRRTPDASWTAPRAASELGVAAEQMGKSEKLLARGLNAPEPQQAALDAYRGFIMLILVSSGFGFAALATSSGASAGTLGRRLVDGARLVRIFGETVALSNSRHSTPWYALNYRRYDDNEVTPS